ncbi:hypothetical protein PGUG_01559 [Meyerozyma guilliermondii ATCC 6260]|uniref:Chromatin modification-related protein EAF3 n=1 Tax=Meyerozyma guilliermondii (strain ATCC 6260 / CBS 566 / DSM 6381 / JCM 1539 / NBRC 10279 / NRRL Y-324) TaxID=294746 RepID=A5DE58_PICGU|nr:uncharacterized protein PGUG_01559 [Meyerozyma guilliermondii ATCC 6260]EDK37461.2 hypothetical protein PGUG_01559 [Meyerozyma guilliermondii ATCC 6260]
MSFRPNSRVLAYHGPLVYEAKVLRVHEKNKSYVEDEEGKHIPAEQSSVPQSLIDVDTYYVHYKGWNNKWDEWVPNSRILEFNEQNLKIQQKLRDAQKSVHSKSKKGNQTNSNSPAPENAKKRSGGEITAPKRGRPKRRQESTKYNEVYIPMRPELKHILVDDWEYITKDHKLLTVPARVPVSQILKQFSAANSGGSDEDDHMIHEYVNGLEIYFNRCLSLMLLYKVERLQYLELRKEHDNFAAADLYGVEHLLRLFASLPGLLAQTTMDGPSLSTLISQSVDFLDYITENMDSFANQYYYASPAYDAVARA